MRVRPAAWVVFALLTATADASSQVQFDGSIGKQQFSQLSHSPYLVREEDGLIRGANSFLSFSQFTLARGDELSFLGPSQVRNIIARVTGSASAIDGTIHSPIHGVNLFLINPAGISFGRSAKLDVFGAFTATTADYIRFADGVKFPTTVQLSPSLSSAVPAAFGFLGPRPPAAIHVGQGSAGVPQLKVHTGNVLSLVGGAIQISHGQVIANGGRVNLLGAGGAGEAVLDAADPKSTVDVSSLTRRGLNGGGAIKMDHGAVAQANLGGSVTIRGGSLSMNDAYISTDTDVARAGDVDIAVEGACDLTKSGIDISTTGPADAGSLKLSAGSIAMHGYKLNAEGLTLAVSAESKSSGNGGSVDLESRGDITIDNHANISSSANSTGNGGGITLHSGHVLSIDGNAGGDPLTGLLAETVDPFDGAGNGGRIRIVSPRLNLLKEGQITARTKGPGDAGLIRLDVRQLLIDGEQAAFGSFTGVEARVGDDNGGAQGLGGRVVIDAGGITLRRGGVITASTFGRGDAGGMQIRTGSLLIQGSPEHQFTGLFARTTKATNAGMGGGINVAADSLRIDGPGMISASSDHSSGNAGGVLIHVTGPIDLQNGGIITVRSDLTNAGNLVVRADSGITLDDGNINASAGQNGGNIDVIAGGDLSLLRDSTVSGKAGGDGGHITLNAPVVADADSTVNGLSGDNKKPVRVRIALSGDLFTSNATFLGGDIITPPPYDLAGQLVNLVSGLAAPAARVIESCGRRIGSDFSSFVVVGQNGLTPTPESPRPSGSP